MRTILYHGADLPITRPVIQIVRYNKDFSQGFYCTNSRSKPKDGQFDVENLEQ